MAVNPKPLTPAQLALDIRARRTKRMMMYNLGLLVVLIVAASGYFAYLHMRHNSPSADADIVAPVDPGNLSGVPNDGSSSASTMKPSAPIKYVSKNYIFICDTTAGLAPRAARFLPSMLSGFASLHQMDLIALGSDGKFSSLTNGLTPITQAAGKSATDALSHLPDSTNVSFMPALKAAVAEKPDAVYLMTTPDQIKQLGADPMATIQQAGTIPAMNCVLFTGSTDSPDDIAAFKKLVKSLHGDSYLSR